MLSYIGEVLMDESIYEVNRSDYKNFLETVKSSIREVKEFNEGDYHHIEVYSKTNGAKLASRKFYMGDDKSEERYYIWNMPCEEDMIPPIPKYTLNLETREEVQAFLDFVAKQNKNK